MGVRDEGYGVEVKADVEMGRFQCCFCILFYLFFVFFLPLLCFLPDSSQKLAAAWRAG